MARSAKRGAALALILLVLLAIVWTAGAAPPVRAQGPVAVLADEHGFVFSESLDFGLSARGEAAITEVILFYGREGQPLVRRIYPDLVPGPEVRVSIRSGWRRAIRARHGAFATFRCCDGRQLSPSLDVRHTDTNPGGFQRGSVDSPGTVAMLTTPKRSGYTRPWVFPAEIGVTIGGCARARNSQRDMRRPRCAANCSCLALGVAMDEYPPPPRTHRDVFDRRLHDHSSGVLTQPLTSTSALADELAMYAEVSCLRINSPTLGTPSVGRLGIAP